MNMGWKQGLLLAATGVLAVLKLAGLTATSWGVVAIPAILAVATAGST